MDTLEKAWARDRFTCKMCDSPAQTIGYMTPPQWGGRLELDNVLSMCRSCLARQRRKGLCAAGSVEALPPEPAHNGGSSRHARVGLGRLRRANHPAASTLMRA
jgi:hypothetical protein